MANRMALRGRLVRLGLAAALAFGATQASAAPVLSVDVTDGTAEYTASPTLTLNPDGTYGYTGYGVETGSFSMGWNATVNLDPSISGTFNLTNLSSSTQTFTLTITLPVAAIAAPTKMGGFFGDVIFTDVGGAPGGGPDSSVTIATAAGEPFYRALIDALGVQDLGAFNVTAFGGPGVFGTISQTSFGTPIPSAPGPAVNTSIGMRVKFSLSAGDRAQIPVFFQVEAPEPSSLLLIGLGLAAVVAARRR